MLCFDLVACYLNRGNEEADIGYNINYMKILSDQENIHHHK
jgi:hypothetical protein